VIQRKLRPSLLYVAVVRRFVTKFASTADEMKRLLFHIYIEGQSVSRCFDRCYVSEAVMAKTVQVTLEFDSGRNGRFHNDRAGRDMTHAKSLHQVHLGKLA
jgi:hypothetical protein